MLEEETSIRFCQLSERQDRLEQVRSTFRLAALDFIVQVDIKVVDEDDYRIPISHIRDIVPPVG